MNLPDPREIANFPHGNPKAKIVQERGRLYVCDREYYWDSEAKRGRERRLYIGRIVDGVYYTMEEYRRTFKRDGSLRELALTQKRSYCRKSKTEEAVSVGSAEKDMKALSTACPSAKRVGMTALFTTLSRQTGLWQDMTDTFGEKACCIAHSLAYHRLLSRDSAASLFASWCEGYRLPASERLSCADCLEFFRLLGETPQWEDMFFRARQAILGRLAGTPTN